MLQGPVFLSHPPLHRAVFSKDMPKVLAQAYYVDPVEGNDSASGNEQHPWRTIQESLEKLRPGDTLFLREGIYFENVYCCIVGTEEAPITICGYPGETVIVDAGIPEFQCDPANAWEPGEEDGEFISTKAYRNIRDVLGLFADSNVGLQTYWHREYLLAHNELDGVNPETGKPEAYYCGPGIFYNKLTGKIHARLAHTHLRSSFVDNYKGETDPRKVPLAITRFRSSPLHLDQAMHIRFRNMILRGGGYNTLLMHFAVNVEFEYVTIFGGTYCIRSKNSGPVKITHCGVYGQIPPWGFRNENSLSTFDHVYYDPFTQPPDPRPEKNIARLPTHAILVTEGGEESDVFFFPSNNHWEVSYCEFSDSHDGLYFNGRHMWLHHCWMYNMQDDVVYLSNPTPTRVCDDVHISQNYLSRCMLPFGAHRRGCSVGEIHIYGNVVDMREPVRFTRPTFTNPEGIMRLPNQIGPFFLAHGYNTPIGFENIGFYHNTAIITSHFVGNTFQNTVPVTERSLYNNIFVYYNGLPETPHKFLVNGCINMDGNLHWSPKKIDDPAWLKNVQTSGLSKNNVEYWRGIPWETHSLLADPKFIEFDENSPDGNDYRLQPSSPAISAAVDFPQRKKLRGNVDWKNMGAFQDQAPMPLGINARVIAGGKENL